MAPSAPNKTNVPLDWKPGDVFLGTYEVVRVLGRGGMGTVYKVHHRGWGIDLAVKCPRASILAAEDGAESFERECAMWINLGLHENITSCYYVRKMGGLPRVFAEYVSGGSLWSWVQKRYLYRGGPDDALRRILDVACQVAWGLHYAHTQGLVHQDVKTANVLMTPSGVAKVTDFGLAKALAVAGGEEGGPRTNTRGTVVYASPEQSRLENLTPATDLWSLGVCILEMFTGEVTWMAGPAAARALDTYLELGPEAEGIPAMPDGVIELLRSCLREDPDARPASARAIAAVLQQIYRDETTGEYMRDEPHPEAATADRLNNRAVSALDLGNRAEAYALWKEVFEREPRHPEATFNEALTRWRRAEISDTDAVGTVEILIERTRPTPLSLYLTAQIHLERGDCERALCLLETIAEPVVAGHDIAQAIRDAQSRLGASRRPLRSVGADGGPVSAVCLSWDATRVLAGGGGRGQPGELRLWDVASGACIKAFHGHEAPVTANALGPDGMYAVSGTSDGELRAWRVSSGDSLWAVSAHADGVLALAMGPGGETFYSAGGDGLIHQWVLRTGERIRTIDGHTGPVFGLALCGFGRHLLSAGTDAVLRLWDTGDGQCLKTYPQEDAPFTALCVSANQQFAMTGDGEGRFALWNVQSGERVRRLRGHGKPVSCVCLSKRMYYALTACIEGRFRVWELRTGRCLHTLSGRPPVAVSDDGRLAVSGETEGSVKVWSMGWNAPPARVPLIVCRTTQEE